MRQAVARARPAALRLPVPLVVFLGAALLLGVPELCGWLASPAGTVWTGSRDVVNYPTYLAKMIWGAAGHWAYPDTLTPEATHPAPVYLPYLLLGHLQAWLGGSPAGWFQGARILLAAAAAALWFAYCRWKWPGLRGTLSFWMGLFAFPAGWELLTPLGRRFAAYDWWVGGHAADILAGAPHYGLMGLALVGVLWLGERARAGAAWAWAPACAGEAVLASTYPWLCPLPLLAPWCGVRTGEEARRLGRFTLLAGAGALPYGLVLLLALRHISWLQAWRLQSVMPAGPLPVVLGLSYGLSGPLAVAGTVLAALRRDRSAAEMAGWAACAIVASYVVPIPNAREMTVLLSLPLGALAAGAVQAGYDRLRGLPRAAWTVGLAVLLATGPALILSPLVGGALHPLDQPAAARQAIRYVAAADPGAVVLADPGTSLWVPAWSGDTLRPYLAHPQETLDYAQRQAAAQTFWLDLSPAGRAAWLQAQGIHWVIWSEALLDPVRQVGLRGWSRWPTAADAQVAGAQVVWHVGGVTVWHVGRPPSL